MNPSEPIIIERPTYEQCVLRAKELYGDTFKILQQREKETGGFLGFFKKNMVEITGYIPPQPQVIDMVLIEPPSGDRKSVV
jgi:hypothetical protein